jgi:hypothetical protein
LPVLFFLSAEGKKIGCPETAREGEPVIAAIDGYFSRSLSRGKMHPQPFLPGKPLGKPVNLGIADYVFHCLDEGGAMQAHSCDRTEIGFYGKTRPGKERKDLLIEHFAKVRVGEVPCVDPAGEQVLGGLKYFAYLGDAHRRVKGINDSRCSRAPAAIT